ncbi:hypothetical protein ANN_23121 [Periplaneta americana]|uniref:Uncharacterized protein n=1 Tax=Periplaneta americana TaxID=6978 RepID=A0ABQ8SK75_PERAM|nr:hypothetical protein ANN_23121 [Periplaneta americana]
MAGLCEGGNEPPDSLKASFQAATWRNMNNKLNNNAGKEKKSDPNTLNVKLVHRFGVMVSTSDHETSGPKFKSWLGQITWSGFSLNQLKQNCWFLSAITESRFSDAKYFRKMKIWETISLGMALLTPALEPAKPVYGTYNRAPLETVYQAPV